jgi:hypothetical protein
MAKSSGHRPGGGSKSREVTQRPVKVGRAAQAKRHEAVAQIGSAQGNKATERARTLTKSIERVEGPRPYSAPLGNATAKLCGPRGEGRTLYGQAGSQQQYGSANPGRPTPARDILSDFGAESAGVRGRR